MLFRSQTKQTSERADSSSRVGEGAVGDVGVIQFDRSVIGRTCAASFKFVARFMPLASL